MGPLFALGFQIILFLVVSAVIGFISLIITLIFAKKPKKKRKLILGFLSPFIFIGGVGIMLFVSSILLSIYRNTDMGFGDLWKVPLNNTCDLVMIDLPEEGYIYCDNFESRINDISELFVEDSIVFGLANNQYFKFNLNSEKLEYLSPLTLTNTNYPLPSLKTTQKFYSDLMWEKFGIQNSVVCILIFIIGVLVVIVFKRIILGRIFDSLLTKINLIKQ